MKQTPILFNSEMVNAILAGMKTQTRRVIKPQPIIDCDSGNVFFIKPSYAFDIHSWKNDCVEIACPYGKSGDLLWVRETFTFETSLYSGYHSPPHNDGRPIKRECDDAWGDYWCQPHYRATDTTPELYYDNMEKPGCRWKPSIHMPRWASRITLEITDVRVEQVQEIVEMDAIAEGAKRFAAGYGFVKDDEYLSDPLCSHKLGFEILWDSVNKKRGYGWEQNSWLWVIKFKESEKV